MGVRDQEASNMVGVCSNGKFFYYSLEHLGAGKTLLEGISIKGDADILPTPNLPWASQSPGQRAQYN